VKPRHLSQQEWDQVRLEYETDSVRPTLRQLADKHGISRSTIFKRAAREHWKQNATLIEATRQQIVQKMEAKLEAEVDEVAHVAAKQVITELQPWIEREKAEHVRRIVAIAKRGFQRIEKIWDENAVPEARTESLVAATLDKHDAIIRRNLGMNDAPPSQGCLNLNILTNHSAVEIVGDSGHKGQPQSSR
jgi:DNA-binding transcriptional regulator YhcF (GntR family)